MKLHIFTDLEGISGIYTKDQVLSTGTRYAEGRAYLTREINIVAKACKDAGVEKVIVQDGHGGGSTALYDQISEDVDILIQGAMTTRRMPGLEECDGVILLGYHAMAGTSAAVLEHSMSSTSIQNYWINGVRSGELGIDAGIVGEAGKPVILVTGDDKCCEEARSVIPGVETACVKTGITSFSAMLLPPVKAAALLREKTMLAIRRLKEIPPVVYSKPVCFRVELMERINTPLQLIKPFMRVIDGRTFEVEGDTMEEAFYRSL